MFKRVKMWKVISKAELYNLSEFSLLPNLTGYQFITRREARKHLKDLGPSYIKLCKVVCVSYCFSWD